jgi:hypothetical protein
MNRRVYTICLAMALVVTFAAGVAQATQLTKGKITEVTVAYQLPHLVNLASRTDEQILQITAVRMPARFTHMAAPVLTDFVYEETSAKNTTPYSPDGSVLLDKKL